MFHAQVKQLNTEQTRSHCLLQQLMCRSLVCLIVFFQISFCKQPVLALSDRRKTKSLIISFTHNNLQILDSKLISKNSFKQ